MYPWKRKCQIPKNCLLFSRGLWNDSLLYWPFSRRKLLMLISVWIRALRLTIPEARSCLWEGLFIGHLLEALRQAVLSFMLKALLSFSLSCCPVSQVLLPLHSPRWCYHSWYLRLRKFNSTWNWSKGWMNPGMLELVPGLTQHKIRFWLCYYSLKFVITPWTQVPYAAVVCFNIVQCK